MRTLRILITNINQPAQLEGERIMDIKGRLLGDFFKYDRLVTGKWQKVDPPPENTYMASEVVKFISAACDGINQDISTNALNKALNHPGASL